MDSFDTPNLLSGGSQLLDQSPQFSFNSASSSLHTGPGGDDLSLSELYPDNRLPKTEPQTRNPKTRPSIAEALGFGAPPDQSDDQSVLHALEEGEEREEEDAGIGEDEEGTEADVTVRGGDEDANRTSIAAQSREEKLQSDLFVLRQLNGAFAVYNDALREAQGGTEVSCSCFYRLLRVFFSFSHHYYKRLAEQLEQTDALLNKYINILSKSEQVKRLIFDERWMGAEAVWGLSPSLLSLRALIFGTRSGHRMKRSLRRRNACGKRSGVARRKSVNVRRSANRSGRRRRS